MGGGRRLGPACTAFHLASRCLALPSALPSLPLSAWPSLPQTPLVCSHATLHYSALLCSALLCPATWACYASSLLLEAAQLLAPNDPK